MTIKEMPPPSRLPPEGPLTAEQAFLFWLQTPHRLNDEYDDPDSPGDVFKHFLNMIDAAGWAFVPRKLTPEMRKAGQGWDGLDAMWSRMVAAAALTTALDKETP